MDRVSASAANAQPMVVGPAFVGEPPPPRPKAADLVGSRMPDFSTVDVHGSEISSDMLRGRPAVVAIWTTWCGPCKEEMPRIEQEIWQEHGDKLAIVAIAGDEDASKVSRFNEEAGYTFTLVPDPGRRLTALFDADGPIPRMYVVDSSGMIVHQTVGYSEASFAGTVAVIDSLLANGADSFVDQSSGKLLHPAATRGSTLAPVVGSHAGCGG